MFDAGIKGFPRSIRHSPCWNRRLVGSVIRGVGDIMLLAGEATETIASSTTGVAENVIRIGEDFAGSLSSSLSPKERGKRSVKAKVKIDSIRHKEPDIGPDAPFVTFGSYAASSADKEEEPQTSASDNNRHARIDEESLVDIVEKGMQEFWQLVEFAMAETQGIPSFALELLGVMLLCYLATLWAISSSLAPYRRGEREDNSIHVTLLTSDDDISELSDPHDGSVRRRKRHAKWSCCSWFIGIIFLPFRTFLLLLSMARRTICNKMTLLLVLYVGAWMYLCRASQLRSSSIQR